MKAIFYLFNRLLFLVVLINALNISNLYSQVRKYSNEFLSVGVGARSLAMSNSTIATINDVTSGYWNPAGLAALTSPWELGLMHSEYFAGIAKYDYLGFGYRLDTSSVLGFSAIRFGVDNIPNTLELFDKDGNIRYDRISNFSAADYAFLFSYARRSRVPGLRYGGNLKIIRRITGNFASAWGFGFDAGLQYEKNHWHFGVAGRDITSTFNAWSFNTTDLKEVFTMTGNDIPENSLELTLPKIILAAGKDFHVSKTLNYLVELNTDATFDGKRPVLIKSSVVSLDPHLGMELSYKRMIFFRMGVGNIQKIKGFGGKEEYSFQPNLGIGLKLRNFTVDYALTDIGDQSIALYSNVFSLKYSFNQ
jgi:hypothetical protein